MKLNQPCHQTVEPIITNYSLSWKTQSLGNMLSLPLVPPDSQKIRLLFKNLLHSKNVVHRFQAPIIKTFHIPHRQLALQSRSAVCTGTDLALSRKLFV